MTYSPVDLAHVAPHLLGAMPTTSAMLTRDEGFARVPVRAMFTLVHDVEAWPTHLRHYRSVRMIQRDGNGGGVVEMTAVRPFGPVGWPTFWRSLMEVDHERATVRFRHIGGLTTGMEVEWMCRPQIPGTPAGTDISLLHLWNGWRVPVIGPAVARDIIGPVFVHGIASRTIAGLIAAAEARA